MCTVDQSIFRQYGIDNSHFVLMRTTCCERGAVEDDELNNLFFVPSDLSVKVSLLYSPAESPPPACPLCGAYEWDLAEIRSQSEVPEEWRWVCSAE